MKHASHKATTVSRQKFSLAKALFASGKGSHSVRAVRAVQSAGSDAVVLGLDPAIAEKINEIAPQTRRSIREAARAAERRSHILASASLAALVGTAAGALAFSNNEDATNSFVADPATTTTQIKRISDVTAASRSEARTDLSSSSVTAQSTNEGGWGLSNSDSTLDAKLMNRNNANNPVVGSRGCRWRCCAGWLQPEPCRWHQLQQLSVGSVHVVRVPASCRTGPAFQRQLRQWWRVGGVSFRSGLLGGQHSSPCR